MGFHFDTKIAPAISLTDFINNLQHKAESGPVYAEWNAAMHRFHLQILVRVYCLGHADVRGNAQTIGLISTADITYILWLGRPEMLIGQRL